MSQQLFRYVSFAIGLALAAVSGSFAADAASVVKTEFIFTKASFPQCHASTIEETPTGLVVAWFGGTHEKHEDVGVWVSREKGGGWTDPIYPCWNPVLFQPKTGPLLLFYKVGPSPSTWWGMLMKSKDGGKTWDKPARLPENIFGPIKNKPVQLAGGRILCGTSTEDQGWRVHMEWTTDWGKTWSRADPLNDGQTLHAIQPAILKLKDGGLRILCRGRGTGKIVEGTSRDHGETWSKLTTIGLPNPNSGIDAVTLKDGRHLLVYNHTPRGRSPLNVAVSTDGQAWRSATVLEDSPGDEFSYPAVIQSSDGLVHITYTWKRRRVKHVVLDPQKLDLAE
jgi:predicted neuraminidase